MAFFRKALIPYYIVFGLICFLCRNHIFFWDTYQLCGRQSWALYENGLANWILPSEIDSGHPPLFGFYHALLWKIFSPSLVVSHLAMIPFICGIVYFYYQIGAFLLDSTKALFLLPFLLVDPVFMGQAVLVSPDIVLLSFMLMCLYGILKRASLWIIIGAIGLGMISMRGMMVLAALILFDIFIIQKEDVWGERVMKIIRYVPAIVAVLGFLIFHYIKTGWMGHHDASSWAESFEYVDFNGLLKNIAVYIWRLLDFGRIALIISLSVLSVYFFRQGRDEKGNQLFSLLAILILIISPILIVHKGLVLHRYMLPIFLIATLLLWYLLFSIAVKMRFTKWIWAICISGLLSGNLWVYPKQISQGWDASLGHLPYYHLRDKMNKYIIKENIPIQKIGTAFPNIGLEKNFDPSRSGTGLKEYDFDQHQYIWYSNIFNDFTDEELDILSSSAWVEEKAFRFYPVCVILYKKEK